MEYPSPSSGSDRADSNTTANRQRQAIAQSNTTTSGGWSGRPSDGHSGGNSRCPSEGAALSSSHADASGDHPDRTTDPEPTPNGDPHARSHTDGKPVDVSLGGNQAIGGDPGIDESCPQEDQKNRSRPLSPHR